jgi:hypothetical protein
MQNEGAHCSLGKGMTYGHISSQIFVTRRFPDFRNQAIPGFLQPGHSRIFAFRRCTFIIQIVWHYFLFYSRSLKTHMTMNAHRLISSLCSLFDTHCVLFIFKSTKATRVTRVHIQKELISDLNRFL